MRQTPAANAGFFLYRTNRKHFIVMNLMDHHILDFNVIPKFKYIPVITEFKILPNILKTIHSLTNRKLKLDHNVKRYRLPREIKHYNCLLTNIKQIKYNLSKTTTKNYVFHGLRRVRNKLKIIKK